MFGAWRELLSSLRVPTRFGLLGDFGTTAISTHAAGDGTPSRRTPSPGMNFSASPSFGGFPRFLDMPRAAATAAGMYSNVVRFVVSVGIRRVRVRDEDLRHGADPPRLSCLTARTVASVCDAVLAMHVLALGLGPKRVPHKTVWRKSARRHTQ